MYRSLLGAASLVALCTSPSFAQSFNRIASFPAVENMAQGEDRDRQSSAEIISASADGKTLIYTDSPLGVVGLVDIGDAKSPKPLGNIDVEGEPTTAHIIGDIAVVGVNTSGSYSDPSGRLAVIDIAQGKEIAACDLGGQPDSVAVAPDNSFVVIAIENERDENAGDGGLEQLPAGFVVKLPLVDGRPDCAQAQKIELTGLAEVGGQDPEPEFVDVNALGEVIVSLQENNHFVILGADGAVQSHFSAGVVSFDGIDTKSDGRLDFSKSQMDVAREPDGVKWIDNDHFVSANEGDWKGGSRGFTIFNKDGTVVYDAGASLEHAIAQIGHYPEKRSKSKGVEIESVEVANFNGQPRLFVVSERASIIAVYDISDLTAPVLLQLLPSGISPEGVVAIPERNLLISANEADLGQDGSARAHVMVYELGQDAPSYPMLTSSAADRLIGWGALGALTTDQGKIYAASDSVYSMMPSIYTIDSAQKPARITDQMVITRNGVPAQKLDIEGLASDGKGGFWLANEGDAAKLVPHAIINVDAKGEIKSEISLPLELLAHQTRFGAEGIALIDGKIWIAMQREWGDDPKGLVKLLAYDLESKEWGGVHYPLEAKGAGWIGLSELALKGDQIYLIERDNQIGQAAKIKKIFRVPVSDLKPAPLNAPLPLVHKTEVYDLLPDLVALTAGYVVDKVEGLTFDDQGTAWVISDNDGVDDSSGETLFWSIPDLN